MERLAIGLDIGSKNVRAAILDQEGNVLHVMALPIVSSPRAATGELLDLVHQICPLNTISTAGVTGRGDELYKGQEGWISVTPVYAAVAALRKAKPGTIIEIGGQSSRVIDPGNPKEGILWRFSDAPLCAAGTGQFLEQQARRMGISIEEYGDIDLRWEDKAPRIAARCSVFAKSDLIHLQQKGWLVEAMLAGLSGSVASMIQGQWKDEFKDPVLLIGGVAANKGVVRAVSNILGKPVIVPDNYSHTGAIGAAILSQTANHSPEDFYPKHIKETDFRLYIPNTLKRAASSREWRPKELEPGVTDAYLGVDVGSTSTKIVIINERGEVLAKKYIMTAGQPLTAIQQIMADPEIATLEEKLNIKAVGVTGSGRYLIGNAVGADLIKNEITAQTRAAKHIQPDIDTVFEIGGQDSKYAYLRGGTVLDYQMNKACAAGTGSFIDELAEQLNTSTRNGQFANEAFSAEKQVVLGEKCTAFMGQSVAEVQHAGASLGEIAAGLAVSLVQNYLSKVVGERPVGKKIFLTGAVFYNEAVVAAFKAAMPDHEFIVPEHKEVTGAIGAALLAKEAQDKGNKSNFKGFKAVAGDEYNLTYANCNRCEHACALTIMRTKDSKNTVYGDRCDGYSTLDAIEKERKYEKPPTLFTAREELLLKDYDPEKGEGPMVGVPRALMAYDLAPMIIGFLNDLGVRVRFTSQTTKGTIELATKHAYQESCFPLKALQGHTAQLLKDDPNISFILIPNAIRLGQGTDQTDQRFACPLVQAAPYITGTVFNLEGRLLDPVIDFYNGEEGVVNSFVEIAQRMGFSEQEGRRAIAEGLAKQQKFEDELKQKGKELLDRLADDPNALGVVVLSRSYNAQDGGANQGMTDILNKLGVIPIPLDYLPLEEEDISDVTGVGYWNYERKLIAAAKIIAKNPKLFGLVLSNFGCGPNSFIQNSVKDVIGDKPLGELEVDEHAAEAGYITRLEAFVDTIRGCHSSEFSIPNSEEYSRLLPSFLPSRAKIWIPPMSDMAGVLPATMRAFGLDAQLLPPSSAESLALSRNITNGKECLPFRDTLGVILLAYEKGILQDGSQVLMAGAWGPCRLGKYGEEQQRILRDKEMDIGIRTTTSNNSYADLGLGVSFELQAWQGLKAGDFLQQMQWATRPYEKVSGETDKAFVRYLGKVEAVLEGKKSASPFLLTSVLKEASEVFKSLRNPAIPQKARVLINGEIYLRANRACNQDLIELCEENGLEVFSASIGEWIRYVNMRRSEDAQVERNTAKLVKAKLREWVTGAYEWNLARAADGGIRVREHSPRALIEAATPYLPPRNGSEAVLSVGGAKLSHDFAGIISVMPHGCMPGGIVASFAEHLSRQLGKPWISLAYDGIPNGKYKQTVKGFTEVIYSGLAPNF